MHSEGLSSRMNDRTARRSPSIVRSAALRSNVFTGWNTNSMGVKIRRILRQVSKACADSADSLLHTGDLVEGDIVGNHNVSALERRRQTLLYVSQECLAIHGPLNDHRCHDASLTQASDKRYRLPVPHGRVCDQAFAARTPAVQAHHIGGDCRFVDEYEAGGIEPALLTDPASARASHVSALPLCRSQAFF